MMAILRAEDGRIRTVWRILIFLVGLAAGGVGVSLGFRALLALPGISSPTRLLSWQITLHTALLTGLWFGWVTLCRRLIDRRPLSSLGLRRLTPRGTAGLMGAALLGGGLICVGIAVLYVAGAYRYTGIGSVGVFPPAATLFIFAAFAEEIVLRGYILQNLRDIRHPVAGVIISAVIFSGFHALNPAVGASFLPAANLFLAGVLLALAYISSGNIWYPTALHYGWNLVEGPVLGTPVSGLSMESWLNFERTAGTPRMLSGGEFGLEGSVVMTGVQCVAICGFLMVIWFRPSVGGGERSSR